MADYQAVNAPIEDTSIEAEFDTDIQKAEERLSKMAYVSCAWLCINVTCQLSATVSLGRGSCPRSRSTHICRASEEVTSIVGSRFECRR